MRVGNTVGHLEHGERLRWCSPAANRPEYFFRGGLERTFRVANIDNAIIKGNVERYLRCQCHPGVVMHCTVIFLSTRAERVGIGDEGYTQRVFEEALVPLNGAISK